ncbi:hypothetical protein DRQ33_02985 [bacterium]|nr:MAG: hypothetical protein DRQ33_02985 [bacterium]
MLWEIIQTVRQQLAEALDVRTVIIGDDDIPASLIPAVKINPMVVASDSSAEIPIVIELTLSIELIFDGKVSSDKLSSQTTKAVETLNTDIYPVGCRLVNSPSSRIYANSNYSTIRLTIRWIERES